MDLSNFTSLLPEIAILAILIIYSLLKLFKLKNNLIYFIALTSGLAVSILFLIRQFYINPHLYFYNSLVFDSFGSALKLAFLAVLLLSSLMQAGKDNFNNEQSIYYAVILFVSFISVSSNNLLLTFVSFEVINTSYFIIIKSFSLSESSRSKLSVYYKFWLGTSSLALLGISLIYGLTGSLNYDLINDYLSKNPVNKLTLNISVILVFLIFGIKLYIFPFQSLFSKLCRDLKHSNTILIFLTSVIAGSGALARFIGAAFTEKNPYNFFAGSYLLFSDFRWETFLSIMFCLSIISTAFILYLQRNLFKIISYMLLINVYYILLTLAGNQTRGLFTLTIYLLFILLSASGVFFIINLIETKYSIKEIKDLKGLFLCMKLPVLFLLFFLITLAGFPFTLGFTGRLYIFTELNDTYILFVIASAAISMFISYTVIFKIALTAFSGSEKTPVVYKINLSRMILITLLTVLIISIGIFPGTLTGILGSITLYTGFVAK